MKCITKKCRTVVVVVVVVVVTFSSNNLLCFVCNRRLSERFMLQVKEEQRLPHLHIRDTTGRPTDDWTTARYQMTNVA